MPLAGKRAWIFDLDGTLTHAVHDFQAIARSLGLGHERPILETLALLPAAEAAPLHRRLADIEADIARSARAQPLAGNFLAALHGRGHRLGILTRNTRANALHTLAAAGLEGWFDEAFILGRDEYAPKPAPDGIIGLLGRWGLAPADAIMIGDFRFDLMAGRAAGTTTALFDPAAEFSWRDLADHCFTSYEELAALAGLAWQE